MSESKGSSGATERPAAQELAALPMPERISALWLILWEAGEPVGKDQRRVTKPIMTIVRNGAPPLSNKLAGQINNAATELRRRGLAHKIGEGNRHVLLVSRPPTFAADPSADETSDGPDETVALPGPVDAGSALEADKPEEPPSDAKDWDDTKTEEQSTASEPAQAIPPPAESSHREGVASMSTPELLQSMSELMSLLLHFQSEAAAALDMLLRIKNELKCRRLFAVSEVEEFLAGRDRQ